MATIDRPSSAVHVCAGSRAGGVGCGIRWRPSGLRCGGAWPLAVVSGAGGGELLGRGSLSTLGVRYLASSKRFSSDDLIKVCRALDKQRIAYRVDDHRAGRSRGRTSSIRRPRWSRSSTWVSIRSTRSAMTADSGSFWDGPGEREQKEKLKLERMLERLIGDQEGVLWPLVSINRPHPRRFRATSPNRTAFVYVETEGGRALPSRTRPGDPGDPGR